MVGVQSICDAVWSENLAEVERLIAAGCDVNSAGQSGWSPLRLAIEQCNVEIVRQLIDAGANVNLADGQGWTPLMHALDIESDAAWQANHKTDCESTKLTELLLAAGAVPDERGFEIANGYGNQKAITLLRQYEVGG